MDDIEVEQSNGPVLSSSEVPQADNPEVLESVLIEIADTGEANPKAVGIHPRQINYYRGALRVLGLVDERGAITDEGRDLANLPIRDQLSAWRRSFERSRVARAWLAWAGVQTLEDLEPSTAASFLESRSDVTGETIGRRALTLRSWLAWLTGSRRAFVASSPPEAPEDDGTRSSKQSERPPRDVARAMRSPVSWDRWTHGMWNDFFVDAFFYPSDRALLDEPLDHFPTSAEDLARLVGADPANAARVLEAFVASVRAELPRGTSFSGYCDSGGQWKPTTPDAPHFVGMLWFTCLVAGGYPSHASQFGVRLEQALGKSVDVGSLPRLWEELASWTRERRRDGDACRELKLPTRPTHRTTIGYSYFLAFPTNGDRRTLARTLAEAGLVGFEPPIRPVVHALGLARRSFSKDFIEDFDAFVSRYAEGEDPRESAFWRAVRREALSPTDEWGANRRNPADTALLFIEGEQGLSPTIVCRRREIEVPYGFELHAFEDSDAWAAFITGPNRDFSASWRAAFSGDRLLPLGIRKLVEQGLLVLREVSSDEYEVVTAGDVNGCRRAFVREDLSVAFANAFRGAGRAPRVRKSVVDGWVEIDGCDIRQVDESPPSLERLTQLLRTMEPPSVALVGGVRVGTSFLFEPDFLPAVRAPGATSVTLVFSDDRQNMSCTRCDLRSGDWLLPKTLEFTQELVVRVAWPIRTGGEVVARLSNVRLEFVRHSTNDHYRKKPSGHFFLESCPAPEVDVASFDEIPLGITTPDGNRSGDMLEFEATVRYLGPGLGEMSLDPGEHFDWLAVGPKKNPELLAFIGDPTAPTQPAQRRSSGKGDHRHWRRAFEAKRKVVRRDDGSFIEWSDAPAAVHEAFEKYRRHHVVEAQECAPTKLDTHAEVVVARAEPEAATNRTVDLLAAIYARRNRLSYADLRNVFAPLLGTEDPATLQQTLRAWTEVGLLDVLRGARVGRLSFVPRRPRFVLVRRGPDVEATLIGLLTSSRAMQVERAISNVRGLTVHRLFGPNPFQPSTFRIRCGLVEVDSIRRDAELEPSEWLDWPTATRVPPGLDFAAARRLLDRVKPPESFKVDAMWDWADSSFRRGSPSEHPIRLERWVHPDRTSIYVVVVNGQPALWTHSRTWALLEASAARGTPPFSLDRGTIESRGRTPAHLPLPVGRLCTLIGQALPGPTLALGGFHYSYPFGARLFELVESVLPADWLVPRT